jgi:hypothetical protein
MRNIVLLLLMTVCGLCNAQVKVSRTSLHHVSAVTAKADSVAKKSVTIKKSAEKGWSDAPKIYGYKINGNGWSWDSMNYGVYSYTADTVAEETMVSKVCKGLNGEGYSVYANGKYYVLSYTQDGSNYSGTYDTYNASTWDKTSTVAMTGVEDVAQAATYDATDKTVYCQSVGADGYLHLSKWDVENNTKTQISGMYHSYLVMASDLNGTLYGIDDQGNLYTINKTTGEDVLVGATGVKPNYTQGGVIDPETGHLYWMTMIDANENNSFLYDVNTTTGAATLLKQLPDYTEVIGCYMAGTGVDAKAPARPTHLECAFTNASLDGNVNFTMPSKTLDGTQLTGNLSYNIDVDGVSVAHRDGVTIGSIQSIPVTVGYAGKHVVRVTASNDAGNGVWNEITRWIGEDVPEAPQYLNVNKNGNNIAFAWAPVTEGAHGGYVDTSKLTYEVTCLPEGKVVSTGSKNVYYLDSYDSDSMIVRYYSVKAVVDTFISESSVSDKLVLGKYAYLPYQNTFSTVDDMPMLTIIDNNNDGRTWSYNKSNIEYESNNINDANDYVILPPMKLSTNGLYKVTYTPSVISTERLAVYMGSEPTVAGMTRTLVEPTDYTSNNAYVPVPVEFTVNNDGLYYIGFKACSRYNAWVLYLDDISVVQTALLSAPNVVKSLAAKADQTAKTITLTFNAPKITIKGDALNSLSKIEIYRTSLNSTTYQNETSLVKTIDSPAVGSAITYVDSNPADKVNTYKLICYNESGAGRDTTIESYVGNDIPATIKKVTFVDNGDGTGSISWDAPTEGYHGGVVDPSTIAYSVLKMYNGDYANNFNLDAGTTSYTDQSLPKDGQTCVFYVVNPNNAQGPGAYTRSNFLMCGVPFATPMTESFPSRMPKYNPSFTDIISGKGAWLLKDTGVNGETPQDNDGGMAEFSALKNGDESSLNSPMFDITAFSTSTLDFWALMPNKYVVLTVNISNNNGDQEPVMIVSRDDNSGDSSSSSVVKEQGSDTWTHYTVSLAKYTGSKNIRIQFDGKATADGTANIYVDNFSITGTTGVNIGDDFAPAVSAAKGVILINGCAGKAVNVFSTNGSKIFTASGKNSFSVPVAPGVYVIKISEKTFKAIVK